MSKQIFLPIRLGFIVSCVCVGVYAQAPKSGAPATYVTPAEMNTAFKGAPRQDAPLIDMPVRVVDAGGHYLGVALVRRTSADQSALVHDKIDEIYYVLDGGGTLVTGGALVDAKQTTSSPTIGPGWNGTKIEGGQTRRVTAGDVVFITAGTAHMFTQLDGPIRYLVYRVDPSKVLALK
jgi:mannose-6-phosphate isomerase-like protein (cupin superfamily)